MFKLEEVEVELSLTFEKGANAGVNIWVIHFGGNVKDEKTHKIKLKLLPLKK